MGRIDHDREPIHHHSDLPGLHGCLVRANQGPGDRQEQKRIALEKQHPLAQHRGTPRERLDVAFEIQLRRICHCRCPRTPERLIAESFGGFRSARLLLGSNESEEQPGGFLEARRYGFLDLIAGIFEASRSLSHGG